MIYYLAQATSETAKDWGILTAFASVTLIPFIRWIVEYKGKQDLEKEKLQIWKETKDSNKEIVKVVSELNTNLVKQQTIQELHHSENSKRLDDMKCKAVCPYNK